MKRKLLLGTLSLGSLGLMATLSLATPGQAQDKGYTGKGQAGPDGGTMCWNITCNPAGGGCCKVVIMVDEDPS